MRPVLLIDFGSTYTKVTAVDLDQELVLGSSRACTTSADDIMIGLEQALAFLKEETGDLDFRMRLACSSAAGGLRMMVSGLVPELTAEAARLAALGAGAKICRLFSHQISRRDLALIEACPPDIFLLTGGTDGGNSSCITGNAAKLASLSVRFPVIYAGNRSALDDCEQVLADFPLTVCPNVMPRFGELNIEPVQKEIRALFLSRIVSARGLTQTRELLSGILMPTPSAILSAVKLLADGTGDEPGLGDLMTIDVGGATTDVYSVGQGEPDDSRIVFKGLEEPYAKRTVEGDIGVRHSIQGIVEAAGVEWIASQADLAADQVRDLVREFEADSSMIPSGNGRLRSLDDALAAAALDLASRRHAGTLSQVFTPMGIAFLQTGKNLRRMERVILTGGSLIYSADPLAIARQALYSDLHPESLRPYRAEVLLDQTYILSAMGVLAENEPDIALRIMKHELKVLGRIGHARHGD
ncbi:MAG: MutL protein [Clostridiaceae bacterium]|nr:MutL protein [Clostridiaceae bacterium]